MTDRGMLMSDTIIPPRAKLFISIIFSSEEILAGAEKRLIKKFGPVDYRTRNTPFISGELYREKGPPKLRVFLSFNRLIKREKIIGIRRFTVKLEKRFMEKGLMKVKIDPGYITLSNVFIATGKDYFHRTYLGKGVYLENQYRYLAKHYQPWEWTPPDLHRPEYLFFFHEMRTLYQKQMER
ncbi:MAG: DUF4416 family protein [Chrysiogenales bacterium]|nr:MAG: DUF4416 family protein [Chrysiogenales bacterium]